MHRSTRFLAILISLFLIGLVVDYPLAARAKSSSQPSSDLNRFNIAAAFTPLDFAPDLWLDGSDNATLTLSGTDVLGWQDKSGNGNHAAPPAANNTPTWDAGNQQIVFDGVDDVLAVSNIDYGPNSEVTVFVVAQSDTLDPNSGTGSGWVIGNGRFNSGGNEFGIRFPKRYSFRGYNGQVDGKSNRVGDAGFDLDPHIVGMVYDGQSIYPFLDGETNRIGQPADPAPRTQQIGIGSDPTRPAYAPFAGRVSEVLIFRKALSFCETGQVEAYLAGKWGFTLPDTHLFKTEQFSACPPYHPFTVSEDTTNGTSVGTLSVGTLQSDITPQNWQIVTDDYSDYGIFAIDPNTGEITIADSSKLDFEVTQRHTLQVTVSDGANTSVPINVVIDVTDVDDGETKQHSELWGRNGELWERCGRLPDYSYAGYHSGEQAIPDIPVAANVLNYGAVPDDGRPDHVAIQAAIDAIPSGAVYLPAGRYIIEEPILVDKSNIVLRGAGNDAGGTTLYSPNSASDIAPYENGFSTGGSGHFLRFTGIGAAGLTDVVEAAQRGDRTLTVANASGVTPGMVIELSLRDTVQFGPLWQHNHNDQVEPWSDTSCSWANGDLDWYFQVERVEGNLVTLKEPLPVDVRLAWQPSIRRYRGLEEVGIEDLRIEFPYITPPDHLTEPGYNGFIFTRVINSWVKNVTVHNSDNGFNIKVCGWVTMDNIHITGRKGHHGGTIDYGEYSLAKNLTITTDPATDDWIHGLTFTHKPGRNVVANLQGNSTIRLDYHRNGPIENLFTDVRADWGYNSSGAGCAGPHAAARNTYWNLSGEAGYPQNSPTDSWADIQTNLISNLAAHIPEKYSVDEGWYEDIAGVQPVNLYEGQLNRRLNLPADPPFSDEAVSGDSANWFERDPSRWTVSDDGDSLRYDLDSCGYDNISGDRLGEYSILGGGAEINMLARSNEDLSENSAADFSLVLGYQDDDNYLYALFSSDPAETGIYRVENGVRTTLVSNPGFSLGDNLFHDVAFKREGNTVTASFDGAAIMSATDTVFTAGRVGIGSFNDDASFDSSEDPLAVSLSYAYGERTADGMVHFVWETATESLVAGFHIHVVSPDGSRVQITPEMIPSRAIDSVEPLRYSYQAAAAGEQFFVEIVKVSGQRKRQGPFTLGEAYGLQNTSPANEFLNAIYLPVMVNQ